MTEYSKDLVELLFSPPRDIFPYWGWRYVPHVHQVLMGSNPREVRKAQDAGFRKTLMHFYHNSPFYRKLVDTAEVNPEEIGLDNMHLLPIVTPEEFLAAQKEIVPLNELPYVDGSIPIKRKGLPSHYAAIPVGRDQTTGTESNRSKDIGYSPKDMMLIDLNNALFYAFMGVEPGDSVHLCMHPGHASGRMSAAMSQLYGIFPVPFASPGKGLQWQKSTIEREGKLGPYHLMATPSYVRILNKTGVPLFVFDKIFIAAEIFSEEWRKEFEKEVGRTLLDLYACTESGIVGGEFKRGEGLVALPHTILEVLDRETNEPVDVGDKGVVHITRIGTDAVVPIIRYPLNDVVTNLGKPSYVPLPTSTSNIESRTTNTFRLGGADVFAKDVEEVMNGLGPNWELEHQRGSPEAKIKIQLTPGMNQSEVDQAIRDGFMGMSPPVRNSMANNEFELKIEFIEEAPTDGWKRNRFNIHE